MVKRLILLVILYAITGISFASCNMTPGGELDQFQSDFYNQAQSFATHIWPTVDGVYWLLFTLWCAWEMSFDRLVGLNIDKLYVWWVYRIFVAYTIEHVFLSPSFYIGILKFGAKIGSTMGGFAVNPDSASPLGNFTPSAIMGVNNCVASAIENAHKNLSSFDILGAGELWLLQNIFLAITALSAFYVLYISIKMWLSMFAGFVNAMFAGSSWTISWWQAYLGTVIKHALELVFVAAMFGIVFRQMNTVIDHLTETHADLVQHYATYMISLIELGFMAFLMMIIPKELANSLGGTFSGKLIEIGGKIVTRGTGLIAHGVNSVTERYKESWGGGHNTAFRGNTASGGASAQDWHKSVNPVNSTGGNTAQQWKAAIDAVKGNK